ncbi:DEAD/DEAH box helicase [Rhodococcus spongiicola]|uniref:DEAD/DEAH box helicase n=1 Tax=Rhodococcus spongiicola TaxID=2487352 RepID=A0A438AX05_9NOCA|nr:DEAD/DEAH box helicase [Rhodococcus spongiicola]RVW03228.1 DEAD/DEAH box helicase [Rhodococcus spongiicola]
MSDRPSPSFAQLGLPTTLVHSLGREGISTPFPIQAAAIPDILAGRDVLGRGPTGSGKTLAFGLPLLVRLTGAASRPGRPRGIVLVPTRELATQIEASLDASAVALGLRMAAIVGGVPLKAQATRLGRGVDLLVATPGRLADHLGRDTVRLDDVAITVVDEADHMAELGFLPQVTEILDQTPRSAQRLLFSATLDGEVDTLVARYLHDPVTHATAAAVAAVDTMAHHVLHVPREIKWDTVARIAARNGRTLLFVRTKAGVDRLTDELRTAGVNAAGLHGDKPQGHRTRVLTGFADGTVPVLVATDVAARGIHVDDVSLVVHVDPPTEPKAYLHRAGRTARAGESGVVVTVVTEDERAAAAKVMRAAGVEADPPLPVGGKDRRWATVTGAREPSRTPVPEQTPETPPRADQTRNPRGRGNGFRSRGDQRRGRPAGPGYGRRRRGGR